METLPTEPAREAHESEGDPLSRGLVRRLRVLLFALLIVSLIGLTTELLLLGHTEGNWQKLPIGLLAAGAVTLAIFGVHRGRATLRLFRFAMVACVAGGAIGIYHHFTGNAEFEREMVPEIAGWELWKEALTGATPVLAPAAVAQTGLVGLAAALGLGASGLGAKGRGAERSDG